MLLVQFNSSPRVLGNCLSLKPALEAELHAQQQKLSIVLEGKDEYFISMAHRKERGLGKQPHECEQPRTQKENEEDK